MNEEHEAKEPVVDALEKSDDVVDAQPVEQNDIVVADNNESENKPAEPTEVKAEPLRLRLSQLRLRLSVRLCRPSQNPSASMNSARSHCLKFIRCWKCFP